MIILRLTILFIILFVITRYLKNRFESNKPKELNITTLDMLKILNKYYITNKVYTFFAVFIYLFFTIFIFIILRYIALGSSSQILVQLESIKSYSLLTLGLVFLCIYYFHKIIELLFYPQVIKLHFFLYQYEWYIWINDFQREHFAIVNDLFWPSTRFIASILEPSLAVKKKNETIVKLHKIIHAKPYIYYIFIGLKTVFYSLFTHSSNFIYYMPHSLVCITLVYEINVGELHYIYHVLFVYVITNAIKKIRKFLNDKDPVFDNAMTCFLYKNSISYDRIKNIVIKNEEDFITNNTDIFTTETQDVVYNLNDQLLVYFKKDYKVYYILDPIRAMNALLIRKSFRRIHLMFLLSLGCIYISYYNSYYTIIINLLQIQIQMSVIILLLPIMILPYLHIKINVWVSDIELKQNNKYNIFFICLTLLYAYIVLLLILKVKLVPLNEGIIWDWGITIIQQLTIPEKITFIFDYYQHKVQQLSLENTNYVNYEYLLYLMKQIDYKALLDSNTPIIDLKCYINNLITLFIVQENMYINNYITLFKEINKTQEVIIFIKNTIIIFTTYLMLIQYLKIFNIIKDLSKPDKVFDIIVSIIKKYF